MSMRRIILAVLVLLIAACADSAEERAETAHEIGQALEARILPDLVKAAGLGDHDEVDEHELLRKAIAGMELPEGVHRLVPGSGWSSRHSLNFHSMATSLAVYRTNDPFCMGIALASDGTFLTELQAEVPPDDCPTDDLPDIVPPDERR